MKKTFVLALLSLLFSFVNVTAQTWKWDTLVSPVTGMADLYKDNWRHVYALNSDSNTVTKLNEHGMPQWQITFPANQKVLKMACAWDSSIYVAGSFTGTFVSGTNTVSSAGQHDLWVARYNNQGGFLWLRTISGKGADVLGDICFFGAELIVVGGVTDTVNFMGASVPGDHHQVMFIARVNTAGVIQAVKLAVPLTDSISTSQSYATDCAADRLGNLYIMGYAVGKTKLDTFSLSSASYGGSDFLLKMNGHSLLTTWVKILSTCYMFCGRFYDLEVSGGGSSYFIYHWSYGQSGSDAEFSSIHKVDVTGASQGNYSQKRKGTLHSIDLDSCGNVYFTGYQRTYAYANPWYAYLTHGQLSPALSLNWLREDSSSNYRCGFSIAALAVNDCFVNGGFGGQLVLADTLNDSTSTGYFDHFYNARLQTIVGAPQNITSPGNQLVCSGQPAVLAGSAAAPINWYPSPTGNSSLHTGNTFTIPPLGAGVYTFYAAASTCSMTTARLPLTVTVIPSPTVVVPNGSMCNTGTFTISPSGASQFYFSSGSAVVSPTSNTTYTVFGVDPNWCSDSALCTISIVSPAQPTISTSINFMCPGQTVTLSVTGAASYTWHTGQVSPFLVVSPVVHTNYSVTALDQYGCVSKGYITQYVAECTGETELFAHQLRIHPNPNNGQFNVESASQTELVIVNIVGQIVYSERLRAGPNKIDLQGVPKGVYFVRKKESRTVTKVIVE